MPDDAPPTAQEPASRTARRMPWRAIALMTVVGALVVTTFVSTQRAANDPAAPDTQEALTVSAQVRLLYLTSRLVPSGATPAGGRQGARLRGSIRRMAGKTANPTTLRRIVVAQYLQDDPGWRDTLLRLRRMPGAGSPLEIERELAMWKVALAGKPRATEVANMAAQLRSLDLGWYTGPALEALHANAQMPDVARRHRAQALRAPLLLLGFEVALFALGGLGLVVLTAGVIFYVTRVKTGRPLPPALAPVPAAPLPAPLANVLYYAFIAYLGAHLVTGLVMREALRPWLDRADAGPGAALVASAIVMVLQMAAPLAVMVVWGRRVGLCAVHLGLYSTRPGHDVLWGVVGYLAGLPALGAVLLISAVLSPMLSRFIDTPANPAITQFAAAQAVWMQLLLAVEAAVLAPLFEETMFRGALFRSLWGRLSLWTAIAATAGVFAIVHPQLPLGFIAIFVLGVVFNVLTVVRGSLVPCIVAHGINNGIIMAMMAVLVMG